jgi:hypothetical protein
MVSLSRRPPTHPYLRAPHINRAGPLLQRRGEADERGVCLLGNHAAAAAGYGGGGLRLRRGGHRARRLHGVRLHPPRPPRRLTVPPQSGGLCAEWPTVGGCRLEPAALRALVTAVEAHSVVVLRPPPGRAPPPAAEGDLAQVRPPKPYTRVWGQGAWRRVTRCGPRTLSLSPTRAPSASSAVPDRYLSSSGATAAPDTAAAQKE